MVEPTNELLWRIGDWLVPALLTAVTYFLQQTSKEMNRMIATLAVVVQRLDDFGRRIDDLEDDERPRKGA